VGLAGGGAAAAWWLGGHQGALLGGVVGAVTGSFAPSLTDWLRQRRESREALADLGELAGNSPAGLLDPRREVVGFLGRENELKNLAVWCQDGAPRGVRLVTGPGGVGKTRLSVELCTWMEVLGWHCVRPGDGGEAAALGAARQAWRGRVLIVVDYAETRPGLTGLLRAVAADDGPVRVLLLSRSAGEWWERLRSEELAVRELLAGTGAGDPLPVTVAARMSNEQVVAAAVPTFAAALGVVAPERVTVEAGDGAVRVLDLHAAALVAVLRSAEAGGSPVSVRVTDVLDELLGHEARFWQGTADRLGLTGGTGGLTVRELRHIVVAGALLGAGSREEAVALLDRVPVSRSVKVAEWLQELYPPVKGLDSGWLGALTPDRLAERLVVSELGGNAELASRYLADLNNRQALRAVTLLGRAAADNEEAAGLLKPLLPLVEQVVAGLPDDLGLLTTIKNAIPYPSVELAGADVAVTRRILALVPPGQAALHARWLTSFGISLAQTGKFTQALQAEEEAVAIRKKLAAADPDRYRPELAGSLSNLGIHFSELGRPDEALPADREAVAIYHELAAANPDRYRPELARSLSNLGVRFSELGRPGEALPVTQEAVAIYRELAAANPDRYRPELAGSLSNLGNRFSELGNSAEALPAEEEAAAIRRELAAADPDRYRPELARSLSNLGNRFSALGHPDDALPADREAVAIRTELAIAHPDRYRPDLAASLTNLGDRLSELGRPGEALPVTQEAVAIYRELAAAYPDRYRPDLAAALSNLSIQLWRLGKSAQALPTEEEAVTIRKDLAAAYPDRYRPDLARSLSNLGLYLSDLRRPGEALHVTEEAVAIQRDLAAASPDRYRPDLARSLRLLALVLERLGRAAEANTIRREMNT
jgi:tetratricopeptide (TPR) repeat protein